MRDGNSRIGRRRDTGGDSRHDLELEPRRGERDRFLSAATEHHRVAALEPHHALSLAREFEQERSDRVLIH